MNRRTLLARSLWHHRAIHIATALGMAIATAVLTGALLVGDSVRSSLRRIVLERLGRIDAMLVRDTFFREEFVAEFQNANQGHVADAVGACILPHATLDASVSQRGRAAEVLCVGCDSQFWDFDASGIRPVRSPVGKEIVLNQRLAGELGLSRGDQVTLRLASQSAVPAESTLGRRETDLRPLIDLKIIDILPDRGFGRFDLRPTQRVPFLAFCDRTLLQRALDQQGKINALLVAELPDAATPLPRLLPQPSDLGIRVDRVTARYQSSESSSGQNPQGSRTAWSYWNLVSDRLVWEPSLRAAVIRELQAWDPQETITYLANSIERVGSSQGGETFRVSIPYSTVSALDNHPRLGPLADDTGHRLPKLKNDEIVLNAWAARQLGAQIGEPLVLRFFEPETTHGTPRETQVKLRLAGIVPLVEPRRPFRRRRPAEFAEPPLLTNDPDLTPTVAGVTDRDTIEDWNPPFPFDARRITREDDRYWSAHRATPKAFVSLECGRSLWQSRFGSTTSIRIADDENVDRARIEAAVASAAQEVAADIGFVLRPVKQQGLAAAAGTTPFEGLFLGFSLFLLASALLLVMLLTALSLDSRRRDIGILKALGWRANDIERLHWHELLVVSVLGVTLGIPLGIGYAALLVHGLRTWWVAAIVDPFVELACPPSTLCLAGLLVLVLCTGVAWRAVRGATRLDTQDLWRPKPTTSASAMRRAVFAWSEYLGYAVAVAWAMFAGFGQRAETRAACFLGAGGVCLIAGIRGCQRYMRRRGAVAANSDQPRQRFQWRDFAIAATARNPLRSLLIVSLTATAAFLLISVSAFHQVPRDVGTGRFPLVARSARPVFEPLQSGSAEVPPFTSLAFAVRDGDDASCQNLYQPSQPTLIGVDVEVARQLKGRFGFASPRDAGVSPWELLHPPALKNGVPDGDVPPIPVIMDQATALYSLRLYGGVGETFRLSYGSGPPIEFRIVGLLANTIFQGNLLIDEATLKARFSDVAGHRMFLIEGRRSSTDPQQQSWQVIRQALESRFEDENLDVRRSDEVLGELQAVQNTYLSTFQALGGLGLLLGTIGLSVVQVRTILERRGEFAILSAVGYPWTRIRQLLSWEQMVLLGSGLGIGSLAALVALFPQMLFDGARPDLLMALSALGLMIIVGWLTCQATGRLIAPATIQATFRNE